jgi:hypothetical protein
MDNDNFFELGWQFLVGYAIGFRKCGKLWKWKLPLARSISAPDDFAISLAD